LATILNGDRFFIENRLPPRRNARFVSFPDAARDLRQIA
jgi:hypothetical protein